MADLIRLLGANWTPPPPEPETRITAPPEIQLSEAMRTAGLDPPDDGVILDGKLRRFGKAKTSWYVAFGDGTPAGQFGDWKSGLVVGWRADIGRKLSMAEELEANRRQAEAKAIRDETQKREREAASSTAEEIWSSCGHASADHPYLISKGIGPNGARVTGDGRLVVPLFGPDGSLASLQYIDHDGTKRFHPGGSTAGKCCEIGVPETPGPVYVTEGFATGATIHEVTGRPVYVAYSAGNLMAITAIAREHHSTVVIVADNDIPSNTGIKAAEAAAIKHGARVVMPPSADGLSCDANDYYLAGHNLAGLLAPPIEDWLIRADDFASQPAPIKWLVKGWLQANALVMVHGPSGGGKTFVVLDWTLHMAANISAWAGNPVKPGPIVYLAGEGHHGLRGRVAAWKHHHSIQSLDMWVSSSGLDLNTATGYQRAAEQIRLLPVTPKVIVVDTLHRFLCGDENSAQDAKTMLDACSGLMSEFCCTVVLVHHTGVNEEAQHRARGSSAWRGALDLEISVVPAKNGGPIEIVNRKTKDGPEPAPVYAELVDVKIPGWIDEDGEPCGSAVIEIVEAPSKTKKPNPVTEKMRIIERAWWSSGTEERDGLPYVSRSALRALLKADGLADRTICNLMEPGRDTGIIYPLINAEEIEVFEHGYRIINKVTASTLLMRRETPSDPL